MQNILQVKNRYEFREWLKNNSESQKECYLNLKRGKPQDDGNFYYLDAVEEALCFGWIDSTLAKIGGKSMQRFSKRQKNSNWTELNIERVKRLEKLGLMNDNGRKVLPQKYFEEFSIDEKIKSDIEKENLLDIFESFPILYQKVRAGNLLFYKNKSRAEYKKAFANFVKNTKQNKMYGQWNDYGRLE